MKVNIVPRVLPYAALAVVTALLTGACASLSTYEDAANAWHAGERDAAVAMARAEYERFREGNELAEASIREAADDALRRLREEVIIPEGEMPRQDTELDIVAMGATGPDALIGELQADLLSGRVTPIIRACAATRTLGFVKLGPALLAVIYRRDPIAADDGVLDDAHPALRSLAAKRAAMDVLEAF